MRSMVAAAAAGSNRDVGWHQRRRRIGNSYQLRTVNVFFALQELSEALTRLCLRK